MKHSTNVLCYWFFCVHFTEDKYKWRDWIHIEWNDSNCIYVMNDILYVLGEGRGHGPYWIICKYISTFHFSVQSGVYLYIWLLTVFIPMFCEEWFCLVWWIDNPLFVWRTLSDAPHRTCFCTVFVNFEDSAKLTP